MLVEITIEFRGELLRTRMNIEPTETRSADSIVQSTARQIAKKYKAFKPVVSWRAVVDRNNPR